jgi:hypothetical protein
MWSLLPVIQQGCLWVTALCTFSVSSHLDFQRKSLLCRVMLQFLQKNIIIAAITMTAIIVIMVLVLLFPVYMRRKQAL